MAPLSNINPLHFQVEEIVPAGTLKPDEIHLPGIYVHRVIKGPSYEKRIEKLTLDKGAEKDQKPKNAAALMRERIARRAALEFSVPTTSNPLYFSNKGLL